MLWLSPCPLSLRPTASLWPLRSWRDPIKSRPDSVTPPTPGLFSIRSRTQHSRGPGIPQTRLPRPLLFKALVLPSAKWAHSDALAKVTPQIAQEEAQPLGTGSEVRDGQGIGPTRRSDSDRTGRHLSRVWKPRLCSAARQPQPREQQARLWVNCLAGTRSARAGPAPHPLALALLPTHPRGSDTRRCEGDSLQGALLLGQSQRHCAAWEPGSPDPRPGWSRSCFWLKGDGDQDGMPWL